MKKNIHVDADLSSCILGSEHEVDVIDVQRQTDVKMQLHEFIEYFLSPARTTVLNLISLEFSNTRQGSIL